MLLIICELLSPTGSIHLLQVLQTPQSLAMERTWALGSGFWISELYLEHSGSEADSIC